MAYRARSPSDKPVRGRPTIEGMRSKENNMTARPHVMTIWKRRLLSTLICFASCCPAILADDALTTSARPAWQNVDKHEDLSALETRVKEAAHKAQAATVSVRVGRGNRGGFAFGSGVIVSKEGFVLTAAHVSSIPDQEVVFRFADGKTARGITLGLHQDLDMGLMKITDEGPWPYLTRARSSRLQAGDWVIATGHPGGFDQESPPVVRLGRILKQTREVILTDCTLVGGDSGGPLVNLNGNVIGVHSRIGADLTTNLHVPIDRFAENWDRLARKDVWGLLKMSRPFIGIEHDSEATNARIRKIRKDGPADLAGLRAGDVIVRFGGQNVSSFRSLRSMVAEQKPESVVTIEYERAGSLVEARLQVGTREIYGESQTRDDAHLLKEWLEQIDLRQSHGRAIVGIGKNADQVKKSFKAVLDPASRSTVKVLDASTVVALGTIIDEHLILTKASALRGSNLRCRYLRSTSFSVEKVAELRSHDLALLKSSRPLPAIKLDVAQMPEVGTLLASSALNVEPIAIGVTSNPPTAIPSEGKLGIRMEGSIPRVTNLIVGSGAELAGVKIGDLITAVNSVQINSARDLIEEVRSLYPGDVVQLTIKRKDQLIEVPTKLARYSDFDEALADFEDFIGGKLSERRSGFPRVIQHDTAIRPIHCGGPVVDIHGRFVGINIARAARTSSYLLPAEEVKIAIDQLRALRKDTVTVGAVTTK